MSLKKSCQFSCRKNLRVEKSDAVCTGWSECIRRTYTSPHFSGVGTKFERGGILDLELKHGVMGNAGLWGVRSPWEMGGPGAV